MTPERNKSIGGTDISAILGLSPYKTALDVWLEKRGLSDPVIENRAMRIGKRMEPVLLAEYEDETGRHAESWQQHLKHEEFEFLTGTPDAIVTSEPRGVELKTAGLRQIDRWGEPGTDHVPEEYLIQCSWYMMLTNFELWDLAALLGGQDFRVYQIARNPELEAMMCEAALGFWSSHVIADVPPELDGSESARRYVERQYRRNVQPLRQATLTEVQLLERLVDARLRWGAIEEEKERCETLVKAAIGDADGLEWVNGKVTWKATKDSSKVDWEALARSLGVQSDLIKKHTEIKPGVRRLLVSPAKEK